MQSHTVVHWEQRRRGGEGERASIGRRGRRREEPSVEPAGRCAACAVLPPPPPPTHLQQLVQVPLLVRQAAQARPVVERHAHDAPAARRQQAPAPQRAPQRHVRLALAPVRGAVDLDGDHLVAQRDVDCSGREEEDRGEGMEAGASTLRALEGSEGGRGEAEHSTARLMGRAALPLSLTGEQAVLDLALYITLDAQLPHHRGHVPVSRLSREEKMSVGRQAGRQAQRAGRWRQTRARHCLAELAPVGEGHLGDAALLPPLGLRLGQKLGRDERGDGVELLARAGRTTARGARGRAECVEPGGAGREQPAVLYDTTPH